MNKDNVVYASLLHDIGKLIGRADLIKKNHSVIGAEYIENSHNENLLQREIINAIKFHHSDYLKNANIQDNDISYIVYEADNIASGIDRRENVEQDAEDYVNKWSKFDKNLCLSSVFNKIKEDTNYSYLLQDLDELKEPNYPFNSNNVNFKASRDKYGILKKELDKNIEYIDSPNSLLQLFEAIMSYIPSSTDKSQVSDISLYDHVKITAAIASCMNDYFCENNIDNYKNQCFNKTAIENNRKQNYYRLISLDLSGIQDFIYTISSKNALKSLRARSFYLEILLEHIIDEILEYLNLSRANLLYSGGGHAYLLLPNTKNTNDCIDKTDENINNWLLKQFSTSLYLAAASIECSSFDLMNNCSLKFEELSKIMSKKKLQRYNEKQLSGILEPQKTNLKEINRECIICKSSSNKINEENICAFCANLINLGKILVSKRSFGIFILKDSEINLLTLPSINGENNYLQVKEIAGNLQTPDTKNLINASKRIYSVNRWYKGNEKFSCNLWLGNYTCGVSEFEELSKLSTGINRLGVMRADVDNLGQIFSKGFNHENYSTLSRYATLSRLLSMFFKHYINHICSDKKIIIIYSGGDDIFVAGAWNEVISFAKELREAFSKYTCDKLTFSCGIGFFSSNYPVFKMAEESGNLETLAKENINKNSIALFGKGTNIVSENKNAANFVYSWADFSKILDFVKELKKYCYFDDSEKAPSKIFFSTTLIYKLMTLITSESEINLARFAYTIARIEPKQDMLQDNYIKLKKFLYEYYKKDKFMLLTILNLIIYEYRKNDRSKNE